MTVGGRPGSFLLPRTERSRPPSEATQIVPWPAAEAATAVEGRGLSAEQQAVVVGLLSSPELVDVVSGPAGSGKTAALRTAADAWRGDNIPVVGCSLAAVTARRLETATGVRSASIARLLADLDRIDPATGYAVGLAPLSVVLVDEASMVGTRHISRLLTHVEAVGGKLVLVGDPAQLSEIDAGGMFAALARYRDPLSLTGNQRQLSGWEREALTRLRDGDVDLALDYYLANGRIHVATSARRSQEQLAAGYLECTADGSDPYAVVALASTREDTAELNTTIRAQLRAAGRLGPDTATVIGSDGPRRYAAGDLVIVTRNDHRVGLLNGTRAVLTDASHERAHAPHRRRPGRICADQLGGGSSRSRLRHDRPQGPGRHCSGRAALRDGGTQSAGWVRRAVAGNRGQSPLHQLRLLDRSRRRCRGEPLAVRAARPRTGRSGAAPRAAARGQPPPRSRQRSAARPHLATITPIAVCLRRHEPPV